MTIDKLNIFLKKVEKERNLGKSVAVLLLAAVVLALTAALGVSQIAILAPELSAITSVAAAVSIFMGVFVGGLVLAAVLMAVMQVLGYKGKYVDGVTVIAYPYLILSVGMLVTALVSYVPTISGILAFLALLASSALGFSAFFKLIMDLYKVNLITALVVVLIVGSVVGLALSGSGLVSLQQVLPQLPLSQLPTTLA